MNKDFYLETSFQLSRQLTSRYSTSFSLGMKAFPRHLQNDIAAIYGFVRTADEIVDTFLDKDKQEILRRMKEETYAAIRQEMSPNPILHAFQSTVNRYKIDLGHIEAFFHSMEMDLTLTRYNRKQYEDYIYGSAEVIGLMCLKVFCGGNEGVFQPLVIPARKLGSAFQKVNFLRDMKSDFDQRGRIYFPDIKDLEGFTNEMKKREEGDVSQEFEDSLIGIRRLPSGARVGVYVAYLYYQALLNKLRGLDAQKLLSGRFRIGNWFKLFLFVKAFLMVHIFWKMKKS